MQTLKTGAEKAAVRKDISTRMGEKVASVTGDLIFEIYCLTSRV